MQLCWNGPVGLQQASIGGVALCVRAYVSGSEGASYCKKTHYFIISLANSNSFEESRGCTIVDYLSECWSGRVDKTKLPFLIDQY